MIGGAVCVVVEGGPFVIVMSGAVAQFVTLYELVVVLTMPSPFVAAVPLKPVNVDVVVAAPHVAGFLYSGVFRLTAMLAYGNCGITLNSEYAWPVPALASPRVPSTP